jgi:predicted DNA-binding transcriptional regulator AlpA
LALLALAAINEGLREAESLSMRASKQKAATRMTNTEKQDSLNEANKASQTITPKFIRVPVAVKYSGISRSIMYELMNARKVKTFKIGACRLICRASLDAFIASQEY